MEATNVPLNDPGRTGIFNLMADGPSARREPVTSTSGRKAAEPARRSASAELALLRSGLWMWLGFVGMSVLAAAMHFVIEDASPLALALLAMPAGAALAAYAWRRAYRVLDRAEAAAMSANVGADPERETGPSIAVAHSRTVLAER